MYEIEQWKMLDIKRCFAFNENILKLDRTMHDNWSETDLYSFMLLDSFF